MRYQDLTGRRFGRLTAVKDAGRNLDGRVIWECLCDCGKSRTTQANSLKKGLTRSCGCLRSEKVRAALEAICQI